MPDAPKLPVDPKLLAALQVLDSAADYRGVVVDVDEDTVRQRADGIILPGAEAGAPALLVTLRQRGRFGPRPGSARYVRVPYNDRTVEWLRAFAVRLAKADGWDPVAWGEQAAQDVLGT